MNRVPLEKKVLSENDRIAAELRERFRENNVLVVNLISSPGSGKTSLLEKTLEALPSSERVAVLTGDIQTENDANRLKRFGFPAKQITTGGTCHLDARMIERHLADWRLDELDLLFIENVGNLVCPRVMTWARRRKIVSAQRHRRRRQAAEISVNLFQVRAAGDHKDRSSALRSIRYPEG